MSSRLRRIAALDLEGTTRTVVEQAHSILNFIEDYESDTNVDAGVRQQMKEIVEDSDEALAVMNARDAASVFQAWAHNVAGSALGALEMVTPSPSTEQGYSRIVNSARDLLDHMNYLLGEGDIRERQRRMLGELYDSVTKAQTAAGATGAYVLAEYFGEYAKEEKKTANRFRWATIVGISIAIAVAIIFAAIDGLSTDISDSRRWISFASHATVVVGVGALTAYLGRQAGQHRRMFNWAKSMEVQLKSFPAFIEPLTDDVQADMYRVFSHRVLSAPPERETGTDDGVPTSQILDVALAALKRAN
ncbi:hypothetical protein ACFVWL_11285 [Microbacterium sp. NPDC058269]|uniref:hypothetical protein n=1 Tax=Microbacterium sp. NPDC058269 TaxID=3346414 RepID=UPI0036DA7160